MAGAWMFMCIFFTRMCVAMDIGSWTDVYLQAGGQITEDVAQTVRQSSSDLHRLLQEHLGHDSRSSGYSTLPGTSSEATQSPSLAIDHVSRQSQLLETIQSASVRQRVFLLEKVEAMLDEKTGLLLGMSAYPSQSETDEVLFSALAFAHVKQHRDILYHLDDDFFLTRLAMPNQDLASLMPLLPSDADSVILVWKQDSYLVQSQLRLLGAIHLTEIRDEAAILSGLQVYTLPEGVSAQRLNMPDEHIGNTLPKSEDTNPSHASEAQTQEAVRSAQETDSLERLVERVLASSSIPREKLSDVVLGIRTSLPPSSLAAFRELVLDNLSRSRRHLYRIQNDIVASKLDPSSGVLVGWTGEHVTGYGAVFWRVDAALQSLTFYGLVRISSHLFLTRCFEASPRFIFDKPTAIAVAADRTIHGQLRKVRYRRGAE